MRKFFSCELWNRKRLNGERHDGEIRRNKFTGTNRFVTKSFVSFGGCFFSVAEQ